MRIAGRSYGRLGSIKPCARRAIIDPGALERIQQHEMAYRMQSSVPELMDLSKEPDNTFKLYGEDARTPGTFAACCLNARRLAERGVRNIQIFHRGWDAHGNLAGEHGNQCKDIDPGQRWTDSGPTSARYARRHARGVGR